MASYGRAVTGTAVMARSANEEKKKKASVAAQIILMSSPLALTPSTAVRAQFFIKSYSESEILFRILFRILSHQSTPVKLDDQLLQAIVAIDDKNRQRFQIGSHSVSGRKELVIRLTPSAPRSFFLARCCLGQVPGGAPFSQRSEQVWICIGETWGVFTLEDTRKQISEFLGLAES